MEKAVVCREVWNQYTGMWGFDTGRDGHWGRQPLLKVRKSANSWAHSTVANLQISEFCSWILEHKFKKRLESIAQCFTQFLLLADKKNSTLGLKSLQKNPRNKKTWDYLWIAFCSTENEGRKPNKNSSLKRLGLCPETSTKKAVQELHISSQISKFFG